MKNRLYYILICIVIIFNCNLLYKNSILDSKLNDMTTTDTIKEEIRYFKNVSKLYKSKYIDSLESIDISSDEMIIKFSLNHDAKDIKDDTQKLLDKEASNIILQDDRYIIFKFYN